jgi:hypothetical protein
MKTLTEMALALNLINHFTTNSPVTNNTIYVFDIDTSRIIQQLEYLQAPFKQHNGNISTTMQGNTVKIIPGTEFGFYEDSARKLIGYYMSQK